MQVLIDISEVAYRRAEKLAQMTGLDTETILAMYFDDYMPPSLRA